MEQPLSSQHVPERSDQPADSSASQVETNASDKVYEERLHWFDLVSKLVKPFLALVVSLIATAGLAYLYGPISYKYLEWYAEIVPRGTVDEAATWIAFSVSVIAFYYMLREHSIWKNTILKMSKEKTGIYTKGSLLFLYRTRRSTVLTREIGPVNSSQTPIEIFFSRHFGWNVWDVTMDTPSQEDDALHRIRYVKDGDRLEELFYALRG